MHACQAAMHESLPINVLHGDNFSVKMNFTNPRKIVRIVFQTIDFLIETFSFMCCLADNIPPFLAEKYVYKLWLKAFTGGCDNRPIDSKQVKILVCKRRPGHSSLTRTNQKILEFSFFTSLPWMCINSSSLMVAFVG